MNNYDVGNLVSLNATFVNASGINVDPTAVSVSIKTPDGAINTYTATRISTGFYTYSLLLVQAGVHYYRFAGTGAVIAAADGSLFSAPSPTLSD